MNIKILDNQNIDSMFSALKNIESIDEVIKVCDYPVSEPFLGNCQGESFNDPSVQGGDSWYLDGMNIPCAWTVTHGSASQVVAVVDVYFDYSHDDLQNKFVSITNISNFNNPVCGHGFATAGAVAAIVNNNICTVGSGYNTKVAGYIVGSTCTSGNPRQGILQAMADGHKTISVSFTGTGITTSEIEEYINDGGTLIHSAFGQNNTHGVIDGYIYVAQANENFEHVYDGGYGSQTGADIYALCVGVNRLQGQNTCSYGSGNTSFGAPTVAGIIALMKSVKSCLSPQDIDKILKRTQGQLPYNAPSGNTAGIMDAYQAVLLAQDGLDLIIDQNTTIDGILSVLGDMIIESGVTLTVTGTIKLAKKLIVRKGAHLMLNGGTLTRNCGQWIGVVVEGNGANQSGAGKVTMKNGALIEGAVSGVSMHPDHIPYPDLASSWGGLITASNSTFKDCRRAVAFMPMDNDMSSFTACNFINSVNDCVTLWDNNNVRFINCTFNNIGKSSILAYDSRVDGQYCTFLNSKNGVEFISTKGTSFASYALGNTFSDNQHGIYAIGQMSAIDLEIHGNNFYGGEDAITLEGMSTYYISNNTTIGSEYGVKLWASSIPNGNAFIVDNFFTSGYWGSLANYDNETQYLNNCFRYNGKDIEINTGSIYPRQGNHYRGASNCFSKSGTPDITAFNNVPFEYYFKVDDPNCRIPTNSGNYMKEEAIDEINNNCGSFSGPSIIYRDCYVTSNKIRTKKMLEEIEEEIAKLLVDEEMDPLLRDYLIRRYRACIAKIKRALVVITKNEPEIDQTKEQAAIESAAYALIQDDLATKILGFSMLTEVALYDEAQDYLDTFNDYSEEGSDFVSIQHINLQYMRNRGTFSLDSLSKGLIVSIGEKTTPVSGFARGLYYKLTGDKMPIEFISGGFEEIEFRSYKEEINKESINIFPNPVFDIINIELNLGPDFHFEYNLMNSQGVVMKSGIISGNSTTSLDVKFFPDGIYFVNILKGGSSLIVKKVVKQ